MNCYCNECNMNCVILETMGSPYRVGKSLNDLSDLSDISDNDEYTTFQQLATAFRVNANVSFGSNSSLFNYAQASPNSSCEILNPWHSLEAGLSTINVNPVTEPATASNDSNDVNPNIGTPGKSLSTKLDELLAESNTSGTVGGLDSIYPASDENDKSSESKNASDDSDDESVLPYREVEIEIVVIF